MKDKKNEKVKKGCIYLPKKKKKIDTGVLRCQSVFANFYICV